MTQAADMFLNAAIRDPYEELGCDTYFKPENYLNPYLPGSQKLTPVTETYVGFGCHVPMMRRKKEMSRGFESFIKYI